MPPVRTPTRPPPTLHRDRHRSGPPAPSPPSRPTLPQASDLPESLTKNLPQSKPNKTPPKINLVQGSFGPIIELKGDEVGKIPLNSADREGPVELPGRSGSGGFVGKVVEEESNGGNRRRVKKSLPLINLKKKLTSDFEFFDPEACPANVEMARRHRAATFIGLPNDSCAVRADGQVEGGDRASHGDAREHWKEYCKCCGLTSNLRQLPICNHSLAFSFLGIGVPLYFSHLKWLGRMLFFSWIFLGMYLFIYNLTGNHCEVENVCNAYGIRMMAGNRDFVDYHLAEKVLATILIVILWIWVCIHLTVFKTRAEESSMHHATPATFSIFVQEIPKYKSKQAIRDFFVEKTPLVDGDKLAIKDISLTYNITQFVRLIKRKTVLIKSLKFEYQRWEEKNHTILLKKMSAKDLRIPALEAKPTFDQGNYDPFALVDASNYKAPDWKIDVFEGISNPDGGPAKQRRTSGD